MIKTTNKNTQTINIGLDIETTGLRPWYGDSVTCICAEFESEKGQYQFARTINDYDGEMNLINHFIKWLADKRVLDIQLVSQNGKEFDIPFLLSRLAQFSDLSDETINFLTGIPHIDLRDIDPRSLSKKAKQLELDEGKSADGLAAIKMAKEGKWDELKSYCLQDVRVTLQVFNEYKRRLGVE